jgi:putative membrane protein
MTMARPVRGGRLMLALMAAVWPFAVQAPSLAQSFPERSGINSFLGLSPSTEDFLNQAVLAEMFEIELSKLADRKGSEKTKVFAAAMLKDHKETSAQLKALVQGGMVKFSYPTALDSGRHAQLGRLQGLSGTDFDKGFEDIQTELHERTIDLFERYGSGGDHPDLKRFAFKHLPHLREHWRLAKSLN